MMEQQAAEELYKEYCDFIFDYIDRDGSGEITKRELRSTTGFS